MIFFGMFVCFAGNEDENRKYLFIEVSGRCGPQQMSVQCGPYKRILYWGVSDYIIRISLTPYKIDFDSDYFSV